MEIRHGALTLWLPFCPFSYSLGNPLGTAWWRTTAERASMAARNNRWRVGKDWRGLNRVLRAWGHIKVIQNWQKLWKKRKAKNPFVYTLPVVQSVANQFSSSICNLRNGNTTKLRLNINFTTKKKSHEVYSVHIHNRLISYKPVSFL